MRIIEVKAAADWTLFHSVPGLVYADDPNWIFPIASDVEDTFNPNKNLVYKQGASALFVLMDDKNLPVGRIAAFIDHLRNTALPYPIGGIGFFECVENNDYADALFERAEAWLVEQGAAAVDGPINFGERDKYWGLLDRGWYPPLFLENYQPRYYKKFFTRRGYIPFEQILTLRGETKDIPTERFKAFADRIRRTSNVVVEGFKFSEAERYARDFCEVYNASFKDFQHFKPVNPELVHRFLQGARPFIDPNLMCIVYFDGKPAGFCLLFPDLNPLLKPFHGKLNWLNGLKFLLKKHLTKSFSAKGMGFGVHPDYRTKGISAFLLEFMASDRNKRVYPIMYLPTIRAHNKEIISIYDRMFVSVNRVHIAYRKALKAGVEIEPFDFFPEDQLPPE